MTRIDLLRGIPGARYIIARSDGSADLLIQTDYDYPGVASTFGWSPSMVPPDGWRGTMRPGIAYLTCQHDGTDGTIDCAACGTLAASFIGHARDFLDDHIGATADDPGYFLTD